LRRLARSKSFGLCLGRRNENFITYSPSVENITLFLFITYPRTKYVSVLVLFTNIRQSKNSIILFALFVSDEELKKSFTTLTPDVNVIKRFYFVADDKA
jgi:hypothetical protein